jgi:tetratricopeptide (TPR) repeat protein
MGRIHQELGHYDQALTNIECALSIQIKSLPPEHFNIATTYLNMGFALYGLQQNQKALECFEKANSIIRKKTHLSTKQFRYLKRTLRAQNTDLELKQCRLKRDQRRK